MIDKDKIEELIENYIKNNLQILVREKSGGSECSYYTSTYVELVLNDKIISSSEIDKLSECR